MPNRARSIAAGSSSLACSASGLSPSCPAGINVRVQTSGATAERRCPAVWTGFGSDPTAKPVALVADAIKDGTRKGDVVLDIFAGTGTTVMAAERVGRHARALEAAPQRVDVAVRRWQAATGGTAIHAESGLGFDQIAADAARITPPTPPKIMETDRSTRKRADALGST